MSDSSALDLSKGDDREKLAGIIRTEFGLNIAGDDPIFMVLRLNQIGQKQIIENFIASIAEQKDDFAILAEKCGKDLIANSVKIMDAVNTSAKAVHDQKLVELNSVGNDLIAKIDATINQRIQIISTQVLSQIDLKLEQTKTNKLLFAILGGLLLFFSIGFIVLLIKGYK